MYTHTHTNLHTNLHTHMYIKYNINKQKIPPEIGFCLTLNLPDDVYDFDSTKINTMIESLFGCIYNSNVTANRSIVLTSNNADICLMMCLKQPSYPVFVTVDTPAKLDSLNSLNKSLDRVV